MSHEVKPKMTKKTKHTRTKSTKTSKENEPIRTEKLLHSEKRKKDAWRCFVDYHIRCIIVDLDKYFYWVLAIAVLRTTRFTRLRHDFGVFFFFLLFMDSMPSQIDAVAK